MSLKSEWAQGLNQIEHALIKDLYHPIQNIDFKGLLCDKDLNLEEAIPRDCFDILPGYHIDKPFGYAWLFSTFILPEQIEGERVVLNLDLGGEATIFINGEPFGTMRGDFLSHKHHLIVDQTLTASALGGEVISLACELYCKHPLPRLGAPKCACATGPVFPEDEADVMVYDGVTIGSSSFGIWNEEAYALYLDLLVLREIMECGNEYDFHVEAIEYGFKKLITSIDMEQPLALRRKHYIEMREILAPLMQAKNGSLAPQLSAIANSHLDIAWLWTGDETRRKTARTFAAQLRHLEEYPETLFIQSQPILYEMCRERYPTVFEKIKQAVKKGNWIADGAMWVEPDTNLSSGESLIRQFLYGKRYFKEMFDVDSRLCWLPDTFGYTAALPQILKGCEVDYLTTQKIYWTYNDSEKFPHHAFAWEGMDGTRINSYVHMEYESSVNPAKVIGHWKNRMDRDGTGRLLLPFGYGDGGGGPTRDDLEQIRRTRDLEGTPKIEYSNPYEFMSKLQKDSDVFERNVYSDELYFPCHRGTYTTQSDIKKGNRRAEHALHEAELWSAIAARIKGHYYDSGRIETNWKKVLFNQFHDILPGSSIAKVYDDAKQLYSEVLNDTSELITGALSAVVKEGEGYTYFNPTSFKRCETVLLPDMFVEGAKYADGRPLASTQSTDGVLAMINIPPLGHVSIYPDTKISCEKQVTLTELSEGGYRLDNSQISVTINSKGELCEVVSKKSARSFINGYGNRFKLYRDIPRKFDSWDIDVMVQESEIDLDGDATLSIHSQNELSVTLKLTRKIASSVITQFISLFADSARIDFDTTIDWRELHKLLKVSFATGVVARNMRNQIQFGYIERPTHKTQNYDADRFEVCNHYYTSIEDAHHGAAVLNDCKYGISSQEDELSLTLLKSGAHPDFRSDNQIHEFRYAYYVFDETNSVVEEAYRFNRPLLGFDGATATHSYLNISAVNIVAQTLKLAEDGSGDIIVRLYEANRGDTDCTVTVAFDFSAVELCNMLEEPISALQFTSRSIPLHFKPFEIKTIRLR